MTASAIRRPPPSSLLEPLPQSRINQVATPSFVGAVWVRSYYSLAEEAVHLLVEQHSHGRIRPFAARARKI